MVENRQLLLGNATGYRSGPILWYIFHQNRLKGSYYIAFTNLLWNYILVFRCCSNERNDFKREPCKVCSLMGWSAQLPDNPQQYNTFQLINTAIGTVYKFRTSSAQTTAQWLEALRQDPLIKSQNSIDKQLPINLMSFEW